MPRSLFLLPVAALLALAGCTEVYTTPPGGGPLELTQTYLTLPVRGTRQVEPPLRPGSAYGHDGVYAGRGQALNSQGAECPEFKAGGGFRVDGTKVTFGPFSGTIQPDGELTMIYGQNTVTGQFVGEGTFKGVIDYHVPRCSYAVLLHREGPL